MKKCLALLKRISTEELQYWLNNPRETPPSSVLVFLSYMRMEFSIVDPIGLDPVKLENNLNEHLYFIRKHNPKAFDPTALSKLILISRICENIKNRLAQIDDNSLEYENERENETRLYQLYQSIDINLLDVEKNAKTNEENEYSIIEKHIETIIQAFKSKKLILATNAIMDFGKFLLLNYPNKTIKEIKRSLRSLDSFKSHELPPLDLFQPLLKAYLFLKKAEENKDGPDTDATRALEGFEKSLSVFSSLMGSKRIQDASSSANRESIKQAKESITSYLPDQQKIRKNLQILNGSLSKAVFFLNDKINYLERKRNQLRQASDSREINRISKRASIVKNAINQESQPISPQENFSSLIQHIQDLINSGKTITPVMLDEIKMQFDHLIVNKITLPLEKYNEERGFLSRFKRWAGDTFKRAFGVGKVSTYGTLFDFAKEKTSLFDLGIKLSKAQLNK